MRGAAQIDLPVRVVLASGSPQRRELLSRLVPQFEVAPPRVDETRCAGKGPEAMVRELARAKAEDVARRRPDALVVAGDTVVECCGEVMGKPVDRADAVGILMRLSRHPHRVITGLCVLAPDGRRREAVSIARIRMRQLGREEIEDYVDREDVFGRAGAYGIEEHDANIESLDGSRRAVMGLPVDELRDMLESLYP